MTKMSEGIARVDYDVINPPVGVSFTLDMQSNSDLNSFVS